MGTHPGLKDSSNTADIYGVITLCLCRSPHLKLVGPQGEAVIVISPSDTATDFQERHRPGRRIALKLISLLVHICFIFSFYFRSYHDQRTKEIYMWKILSYRIIMLLIADIAYLGRDVFS